MTQNLISRLGFRSRFSLSAIRSQGQETPVLQDDNNALVMIGIVVFGAFISGGLVIVFAWVGGLPISW